MFKAFFSDPHFGHANIIKHCNRPFVDVQEMNEAMVANYNKVVGDNDTVLWLGDCIFKGSQEMRKALLKRMNGRKLLIVGNHDQTDATMAKHGFDLVMREAVFHVDGIPVRCSHYPYYDQRNPDERYVDLRPERRKGEVLLHGHSHSPNRVSGPQSVHVGVDAWDYGPAPFGDVVELIWEVRRRQIQQGKP